MRDGRVAVPSLGNGGLEAQRSGHFGHCDVFTLIDLANGEIAETTVVPNAPHAEGGCLVPVNLLAAHKVTALIAGGMGLRPLQGFKEAGIDVYFDTEHAGVKDAIGALVSGGLEKMTENRVCGGHH